MDYSDIEIVSKEDGGSFMDAYIETWQHKQHFQAEMSSRPYDRSVWLPDTLTTMTVNACYDPTSNAIYIFAGILADLIYDSSMTDEQLLANIGSIIGHEITHGSDSSGMTISVLLIFTMWNAAVELIACSFMSIFFGLLANLLQMVTKKPFFDYWVATMFNNVGNSFAAGQFSPLLVLAIVCYIVLPLVLTAVILRRKELAL